MKKILLFILILSSFHSSLSAQWISQNSGITHNLYDIEFLNDNTGWAVGDGGIIVKTINGGKNWIEIPNPAVGKPLSSIHLVNENVAYVVGWFETIIKTTDGGDSWIEIRNWTGSGLASYEGVFFINENTGWFAGTGEKILKTTDGGQTLDSTYIFWGTLWDIYFKDVNTGIISATGNLFKTTNSGQDWFETNIPLGGSFPLFRKVSVIEDTYCWMVGNSRRVYRSTDFGSNWIILDTIDFDYSIIGVEFGSPVTGWAGGTFGNLFKTTDGGYNWHLENTLGDQRFWASLTFKDSLFGWGCGGGGKIFHTTTGGQTLVNISNHNENTPGDFILNQNYPNPFNPGTKIIFDIPGSVKGSVKLKIYDALGKEIAVLIDKPLAPGSYEYDFNANNLSGGVYFYTLSAGEFKETKRMMLVK